MASTGPVLTALKPFLLAVALGCVASPAGASKLQTGTFDKISFENTSGRVGYHMYANVSLLDSDTPTGTVATCGVGVSNTTVRGTVPPGLTLLANDNGGGGLHGFDGTPRQPGDWTGYVVIAQIGCAQGADQTNHGPKTVEVHFHITP